ncbi:unnamed protein product [Parnassius apollo]|uniref:(apollo) hypothetical protein n=1 Tax=Parnassius apollo TaxID=110799 RepID=A0A8S3X4N3_PARAO|nr:unnamed protein product [Parnassius apollo]
MATPTSVVETTLGLTSAMIDETADALGIGENQKDVQAMTFTLEQWTNNQKIREAVAYIRLDAKKIVEQFFKKAEENPIGAADKPITIRNVSLYEKNAANTDLMLFLNVFLERGNNLQKALLRCDDTIAPVLRRKANAYGIVLERTKTKPSWGRDILRWLASICVAVQCTGICALHSYTY